MASPFWRVWKTGHREAGKFFQSHMANSKTKTGNSMPGYSDSCVCDPGVAPVEDAESGRTCCLMILGRFSIRSPSVLVARQLGLKWQPAQHNMRDTSSIVSEKTDLSFWEQDPWPWTSEFPVALKYCKALWRCEHCGVMKTKPWPQLTHECTLPRITVPSLRLGILLNWRGKALRWKWIILSRFDFLQQSLQESVSLKMVSTFQVSFAKTALTRIK